MARKRIYTDEERLSAIRESKRKWKKNNPEKIKEGRKKYRENNPEKVKERVRKWQKSNPEKVKEINRKWKKENPDKVNENQRKWRENNPEMTRAIYLANNYRQNDKKHNRGECTITAQWIVDNVFSGQRCFYCGETDWTELGCDRIDNSLPHTPENVVCCCEECNKKRGSKPYEEFCKEMGVAIFK